MAMLAITSKLFLGGCIAPNHHGQGQGHRNLTGEWVLLGASGLTKNTVVEQVVYHADGSQTRAPFATLPETPPAMATQVQAVGGHGVPYMDGTRWVFFNQSSQPKLNNLQGETLRVTSPSGVVLAEKTFPANSCDVLPAAPKKVVVAVGGSAAAAAAFGSVR
jgi:hypothetical protein